MELPTLVEGKEQELEEQEAKKDPPPQQLQLQQGGGSSIASRFASFKQSLFKSRDTAPPPEEPPVPSYEDYVKQARETQFTAEDKQALQKFIYEGGVDMASRPIVVVVGSALPAKMDPDRLFLYVIYVMDSFVENDYTIVYLHTNASLDNRPPFSFLRKAYRILNRKYKKNLKSLFIVHPTFWVRTTFKFFKPFISNKFWQKLTYVHEISDLFRFISRDQITLPQLVFDFSTSNKKVDPIFGTPLEEVLGRPDHADYEIPIVVHKCIEYLKEKKANNVQGIFRLSGGALTVQQLRKDFDRGEDVSLTQIEDPHVVAGLLKLYFRELPDPLFPFESYHSLIEAFQNKEKQLESFRTIFSEMPPPNKALLKSLIELMAFIVEKAEINKMNSSNLSIVFAPNLIRPPPKESAQLAVMHAPIINSIMRAIIDAHEQLIPALSK